jgi:hypothetical protein
MQRTILLITYYRSFCGNEINLRYLSADLKRLRKRKNSLKKYFIHATHNLHKYALNISCLNKYLRFQDLMTNSRTGTSSELIT